MAADGRITTPVYPMSPATPITLSVPTTSRAAGCAGETEARRWFGLALGSLVLAGLLSLTLVIGRLPFLGWLFTDPLFFRRALVVHVDLAIVVWFQAGALAFLALALGPRLPRLPAAAAFGLAATGVIGLLVGAVMPGAEPVLSNYVPVIDHPVFFLGLVCWFTGVALFCLLALATPARTDAQALNPGTVAALRAAAAANVIAIFTFAAAWRTTPDAPAIAYYELVFWGGGHVLQAANVAAMLGLWLHLVHRWTGQVALGPGVVTALMLALVLPELVLLPLALEGTTHSAYFSMATLLMRWTIFPVTLVALAAIARHLWRRRSELDGRDYRCAGLAGSAALTMLGFLLGALIRGSSTLVPGHYHCAIGAVTLALMTAAYDFMPAVSPAGSAPTSTRRARLQLLLFGGGQAVFGLGFSLAGAYGLGRKQYGSEQNVRSLGEYLGLSVMGLGGVVAVAGGLFFLAVMLRQAGAWRRASRPASSISHEPKTQNAPLAKVAR